MALGCRLMNAYTKNAKDIFDYQSLITKEYVNKANLRDLKAATGL